MAVLNATMCCLPDSVTVSVKVDLAGEYITGLCTDGVTVEKVAAHVEDAFLLLAQNPAISSVSIEAGLES